jgi:hypothetical protein
MRHILCAAYIVSTIFSTLSLKGQDFRENFMEHKMRFFDFLFETLLILRRIWQDIFINVKKSSHKVSVILVEL